MDPGFQLKNENPRKKANFLSKLFFTWMIKLFYKGKRKGLHIMDLYKVMENDKSDRLGDLLEQNWEKELNSAKLNGKVPSLLKVLFKSFGLNFMIWGIAFFSQMMIRALQPIVLSNFIKSFSKAEVDDVELNSFGAGLVLMSFLTIMLNHHGNFRFALSGMRCRIALSSLIYRKITRLNQVSLGQIATGQVVNLLSNDVSRFDLVVIGLHAFWVNPILVLVVSYFLWQEVGISCLTGIFCMALLSLPLQSYLAKLTGHLRMKIAKKTDHRVRIMNEIISGIQVIKMYAWEIPFEKVVKKARAAEVSDITTTSYYRGVYCSFLLVLERTSLFLTITCYVVLGYQITSDKVFAMAQFFNTLQLALAVFYPIAISYGAETLASIERLRDFLVMEEKEVTPIGTASEGSVQTADISASWSPSTPTLENISFKIQPGILCAIVGPVGSGKSSLLQLMLGELPASSGQLSVGGGISYASQDPWLFAASVRNNILFGEFYDKQRYDKVVKVCALEKDFKQFPHGDKTLVGDRGVSLSGGQKARINLARSIYRQADIYIMDDPLSAVDTHVGRYLFDECICKHLKKKTRILVTHQLQYLKKAHLIIVMNKGRIETMGTFDELAKSKLDFTELLSSADESSDKPEDAKESLKPGRKRSLSIGQTTLIESIELLQDTPSLTESSEESGSDPNISSLKEYMKAPNNTCVVITVLVLFLSAQIFATAADYWVAFWTNQEEMRYVATHLVETNSSVTQLAPSKSSSGINSYFFDYFILGGVLQQIFKFEVALYIYGSMIIFAIVITLARSFLFFKSCMMASKNLHAKMFHCLLLSPMKFFNTNPSGRILNRFSKDMGAIDEILPKVLLDAAQITLVMFGILINVGISNPYAIIAIVICGILFWTIRGWYISSAQDIKHLEATTKSPVFSHISSTMNGIPTIRASNAESILISEFDNHQNAHTSAWYLTIACMVSFGLWLDIICVFFIACITFSFIILKYFYPVYGSFVGLAISQSMVLTGMLQFGMRQTAEVINQLTSVERVLQYSALETEGPFETPKASLCLKPIWPSQGKIEFRNLSLRYIETDPPVLKRLNFVIKEGEKVGIVGRTGAGKSSLISALFRLAFLDGSIYIDEIDTKIVGLSDLRKKISIIPQEPVLFSATLRYNLDPFEEYDDAQIWRALEEVELRDAVPSLNYLICEGGSNFSLGQRQLICLARAILRNNKILILDEATANVDLRTDSFIQTTIREKFKNCTVLTIAHRLNTIMDSDRVLVMNSGVDVEFDHPYRLLQFEEGYFTKMVQETGPSMSQQLRDIAWQAFQKKKADSS